ncbi:hypothetical protein FE394_06525 [Xenorhabdus sp. Reich]|uniref:O-antigen polymerase n=1 Tax=Xenorhabdus littoralis TaxID=2582835 RepID=A0ABU4SJN8_9GAMM|nr:oligosaccharide repeat unit polymerase [Xenorhabdus sp. Reich]MDX7998856.1 hypothetical protein [Xenorhabdus sp. Reich]
MIINPVYILALLYFFTNFIAMLTGIYDGGLILEGKYFSLKEESLIYAFLMQAILILFIIVLYNYFNKKTKKHKFEFRRIIGVTLLLVQISYIIFNKSMGVNIAGDSTRLSEGSLLNYLFILLQPDILYIIIGIHLSSNRLFFANTSIYLLSMFLRGWMGGVFIVFFTILFRYNPSKISLKNLIYVFLFILIAFLLLPMIIDAKWAMRTGMSLTEFIYGISDSFETTRYKQSIYYILNRFQHIGHVALLLENSDNLYQKYISDHFVSYWWEGLPQQTILKISDEKYISLSSYIVTEFYNIKNPSWNINPGLSGWFFILQDKFFFLVLYLFLFVTMQFYYISRKADSRLLTTIACFSLIYLFHGWFGAYFNILLYSVFIILIYRFSFYLKRQVIFNRKKSK